MARKKRCELGASCPYQHEGQHQAEYYHTASPARREGRRGRRLGGAGATTTARRGATTAARRGSSRQTPQRTPRATSRRSPIVIDDSPDRTASLDDDDVELISPPPRARSVPEAPKGRSYEEDLAKALALSKADNDRAIARAQDAEFEASLAEDRRKASKRDRDDLERREQAELERALAASKEEDDRARDTRKRAKKAEFQTVQEPTDDVVRVRLRLPVRSGPSRLDDLAGRPRARASIRPLDGISRRPPRFRRGHGFHRSQKLCLGRRGFSKPNHRRRLPRNLGFRCVDRPPRRRRRCLMTHNREKKTLNSRDMRRRRTSASFVEICTPK